MADDYRYWGFISYSHADEPVARRLHRALEHYALPRRLRRAHGLPRRLIPIFRDVDELAAASELGERLRQALDQSRWLIVLCSPDAARSRYVNDEIEYFARRHGAARILCALVAGEPAEALPPAIRALDKEPLAADFRAGRGFELGKLKLIAAIAGIGFAELRNREAQRVRRLRLAIGVAVAGVTAVALAAWDLFYREQVEYYEGYVREHGIWRGVDRVSAEAAARRSLTWRFTRRGRLSPPIRADRVTGLGVCSFMRTQLGGVVDVLEEYVIPNSLGDDEPAHDYCSARFVYAGDGTIREEQLIDVQGRTRFTLVYTSPTLAQVTRGGFADASEGGGIRYVEFVRDAAGRDSEVRYRFDGRSPRRNRHFAYGYRYEYDPAGRRLSSVALNSEYRPTDRAERYTYTPEGWLGRVDFVDAGGASRLMPDGASGKRQGFDQVGNAVVVEYLGPDGRRAANRYGYAVARATFTEAGLLLGLCVFNAADQPVSTALFSACLRYTHDDRGRVTRTEKLGLDGRLARTVPAPLLETLWGEDDSLVEERVYNADGKLAGHYVGAINTMTSDARGNLLKLAFHNEKREPILTAFGAAIVRTFDEHDRVITHGYVGLDGKLTRRLDGPALRRYERDERGNIQAVCHFDEHERPMLLPSNVFGEVHGYACMRHAFDAAGNVVDTRYFGVNGEPVVSSDGYARVTRRHDALGREVERRGYDLAGQPADNHDGVHGARFVYDIDDHLVERTWLGRSGSPVNVPEGATTRYSNYVAIALGVDLKYVHTRSDRFDAEGRSLGYATFEPDFQGNPVEIRHYRPDGTPTPAPVTGCAVFKATYTPNSYPITEDCLGPDEKPVNRRDLGWASHRATLANLAPVKHEYFDAAGKPVKPKG